MNINDLMEIVIGVLVTRIYMYYAGYRKPKQHPYRWVCWHEGCSFKCSATNMMVMNKMADHHLSGHEEL